eukprot:TRINITY_DN325_c0_g2_i1.p1 TRINITY_DN325_c0_g2~~TRINITY_DN325_c0_g2_i1.p1  ORF type:complete len:343 (+),score=60.10 TRINITY_DN325_c0_g2_i1:81-1109(+)
MAFAPKMAVFLLVAVVVFGSQVLSSSALTEEDSLRAAISDPSVTSFELKANIKLTKNLPVLALPSGSPRTFRLFSTGGYTIDGAKKYRGFYTPGDTDAFFREFPLASLTIDNVKFVNFRVKFSRSTSNDFPSIGFNGAAIGVEKTILKVINSAFSGCSASGTGGAIYVFEGSVDIKKSTFSKNKASIGGALDIATGERALTIADSSFTGNVANGITAFGGAVNIQQRAIINIIRTTFQGNTAGGGGAFRAIFNAPASAWPDLVFDTVTFKNNKGLYSADGGAALDLNGIAGIKFVKSTFTGNTLGNGVANDIFNTAIRQQRTKISVVSGKRPIVTGNNFRFV